MMVLHQDHPTPPNPWWFQGRNITLVDVSPLRVVCSEDWCLWVWCGFADVFVLHKCGPIHPLITAERILKTSSMHFKLILSVIHLHSTPIYGSSLPCHHSHEVQVLIHECTGISTVDVVLYNLPLAKLCCHSTHGTQVVQQLKFSRLPLNYIWHDFMWHHSFMFSTLGFV